MQMRGVIQSAARGAAQTCNGLTRGLQRSATRKQKKKGGTKLNARYKHTMQMQASVQKGGSNMHTGTGGREGGLNYAHEEII